MPQTRTCLAPRAGNPVTLLDNLKYHPVIGALGGAIWAPQAAVLAGSALGPVAYGDEKIIRLHLRALESHPMLAGV
jgi:hypothetical protein